MIPLSDPITKTSLFFASVRGANTESSLFSILLAYLSIFTETAPAFAAITEKRL
jgi:hypothetical protein